MNRYTRKVDGSTPIRALLYDEEELISSQDGVGLYDGKDKSPDHQSGTTHLTTHRLFYIDASNPRAHSLVLNLSNVRFTDHYAGFVRSSAKVTLFLGIPSVTHDDSNATAATTTIEEPASVISGTSLVDDEASMPKMFLEAWICPVCSYSNPPSANEGRPKCYLCGVTRDMAATVTPARPVPIRLPIPRHDPAISRSLPASSAGSPGGSLFASVPPSPTTESTSTTGDSLACPACTFLNHSSMKICELCSTPLRTRTSTTSTLRQTEERMKTISTPNSSAASRASTPAPGSEAIMKISFRKGGDRVYYAAVKKTLQEKAWNGTMGDTSDARTLASGASGPAVYSGIHGLIQAAETSAQARSDNLANSLRDLESLKSAAKQMVETARLLNAKLTAQEEALAIQRTLYPDLPASQSSLPEEATFIRSSMVRLGLPSVAVTQDMVKDDKDYHDELAKELAGVLTGSASPTTGKESKPSAGLMQRYNGIIGLDEAWCGWNRARGVALVPPSALITVTSLLPRYTNPPIQQRRFRNGLCVLHTPRYTHSAFAARLEALLTSTGPKTSVEISREEEMSVGLAEQMIEAVEEDGGVVRDQPGGYEPTKWYANEFSSFVYDGTT